MSGRPRPPQVGQALKVVPQRTESLAVRQRLALVWQVLTVPSQVTELVPTVQVVLPEQVTTSLGAEQLRKSPEGHSVWALQALLQVNEAVQPALAPCGASRTTATRASATIPSFLDMISPYRMQRSQVAYTMPGAIREGKPGSAAEADFASLSQKAAATADSTSAPAGSAKSRKSGADAGDALQTRPPQVGQVFKVLPQRTEVPVDCSGPGPPAHSGSPDRKRPA